MRDDAIFKYEEDLKRQFEATVQDESAPQEVRLLANYLLVSILGFWAQREKSLMKCGDFATTQDARN